MRATKLARLLALVGVAALTPAVAWASVFMPVSDQQLVCESTEIVRGTVIEVNSVWEGNPKAIWTYALVQVDRPIRGNRAIGEIVQIKEIGGTVGDYTIVAQQFPTFQEGEDVVMLLSPWDDGSGVLRVHGFGRGMFSVSKQHGRPDLATRYDVIESRRPVMHVDHVPPVVGAEDLVKDLGDLSGRCAHKGGGR